MLSNNLITSIMFYLFSLILILSALFTLFSKKIVYSLVSAIAVFLSSAGLFFTLGAEYNSVIQFTVYCTAIPILLAFAIMFTDYYKDSKITLTTKPRFYLSFLIIGIALSIFIFILKLNTLSLDNWTNSIIDINNFRVFASITEHIFMHYIYAFEFLALLLLIVIVGISNHDK